MPLPAVAAAGIIPAYAGSTSADPAETFRMRDHPRIRGEHISCSRFVPAIMGSSPHTRGAQRPGRFLSRPARIIPAYAGSTRSCRALSVRYRDHPRIRGEHTRPWMSRVSRRWIIPAYAGSTRARRRRCAAGRDHPRIRGEHLYMLASASERVGSSPHTRGAQTGPFGGVEVRGIIPAYAGSTNSGAPTTMRRTDHPRIRGEHLTEGH